VPLAQNNGFYAKIFPSDGVVFLKLGSSDY
jgi:hypothetical protein